MQQIEKIVVDESDKSYGYYLALIPETEEIKGVLILLPGLGQKSEDVFTNSDLPQMAFESNIAVLGFAGRMRMTADDVIQEKLNSVIEHAIKNWRLQDNNFIIGGFSAGGTIALRYTERCYELPSESLIQPVGVFMADSPIDLFQSWVAHVEYSSNDHSNVAENEATWIKKMYEGYYGATPFDDTEQFQLLTPFSMDKQYGQNEQVLIHVAVRVYHDVDIAWWIQNRNQTPKNANFIATAELIN